MNEPLGIALELMQRRKALAARLSPQARKLAFPEIERRQIEIRRALQFRIKKIESDWSAGKRVTSREKALAMQSKTRLVTEICARIWQVPVGQIYDATRLQIYVLPRRASMALMRTALGMSLPAIGHTLNRDHTTIQAGLARHEESYDVRPDYARKFDDAEQQVRQAMEARLAA